MENVVHGVVKGGVIVPQSPLPEGVLVEIRVVTARLEMPPEWQEEFEAWNRASDHALGLVERLAEEGEPGEAR